MQSANKPIPVEKLARAVLFTGEGGLFFVTHKGELIGPGPEDEMLTKAALYLASHRERQNAEG